MRFCNKAGGKRDDGGWRLRRQESGRLEVRAAGGTGKRRTTGGAGVDDKTAFFLRRLKHPTWREFRENGGME
uniref:Uncharacterized protein n=1 Tax=Cucumis melo TaxID=3656 RepID=A0A9I9DYJ1_CUCME